MAETLVDFVYNNVAQGEIIIDLIDEEHIQKSQLSEFIFKFYVKYP